MDSFVEMMSDVTLRPRTGFRERLGNRLFGLPLLFAASSGVMQSMLQGASNNMGARTAIPTLLAFAFPIGIAWGLLQVHVVALLLWVVARSGDGRIPYLKLRDMAALASVPNTYAFVGWMLAAVIFGRIVFIRPELWPAAAVSPPAALALALLYFATTGCAAWTLFLLLVGVREVEEGTWGEALTTLGLSVLLLVAIAAVIGLVLVFVVGGLRPHARIAA